MSDLLGLPFDASAHGGRIDSMLGLVHWLMLILFVGWGAFFVYTLIRFRSSKQKSANYTGVKSHASSYLEVAVAVFEAVLLIGFAVPLWSTVVNAFPAEKDATVVRVIAEQFAWNAHYPGPDGVFGRTDISMVTAENPVGLDRADSVAKDDIVTINELNLPVGKPVILHLTSKDVIHSLNIPLLRVKQDAIPGQSIPVWFVPTKTNDEIRKSLTKTYSIGQAKVPPILLHLVAMVDYQGKDGAMLLSKGTAFTEEVIPQLRDAGINEVIAGPDTPMEIACAQLCGLGHYKMRGVVTIQTEDEYKAWLALQASYLVE